MTNTVSIVACTDSFQFIITFPLYIFQHDLVIHDIADIEKVIVYIVYTGDVKIANKNVHFIAFFTRNFNGFRIDNLDL